MCFNDIHSEEKRWTDEIHNHANKPRWVNFFLIAWLIQRTFWQSRPPKKAREEGPGALTAGNEGDLLCAYAQAAVEPRGDEYSIQPQESKESGTVERVLASDCSSVAGLCSWDVAKPKWCPVGVCVHTKTNVRPCFA